jgi:hypothetical protein
MVTQKLLDDIPLGNVDFVTLWSASGAKAPVDVNKLEVSRRN